MNDAPKWFALLRQRMDEVRARGDEAILYNAWSPSQGGFGTTPPPGMTKQGSASSISSADYIRWVQRSLNRLYGAGLATDGEDSSAYRASVGRFNKEYLGRGYEGVDEQTQNQLIYVNGIGKSYVGWVIRSLNQLGLGPLSDAGSYTSEAVAAIKAFQRRPQLGLDDDGNVGAKTELALIEATGTRPPGDKVPKSPEDPPARKPQIRWLSVWLNVFIPNDLPEEILYVPFAGPHIGKIFVRSPSGYFATDQRSWSKRPGASSRMHSQVEILLLNGTVSSILSKRVDETIRIDRFGKVECQQRASTNTMSISKVEQPSSESFRFSLTGEGTNPCSPPGTPSIDYRITVGLTLLSDSRASINVSGVVDEFPSFEMYATVNNDLNDVVTLLRLPASEDPFHLFGDAVRPVSVSRPLIAPLL